uniref:Protein quiver n=1 Tax=Globodera rostochiensis TaxID=31243 RepID=A0A914HRE8_GLORO
MISGQRLFYIIMMLIVSSITNNHIIKSSWAISCYDCRSEDISCNVGECVGSTCVKMETSNVDNERKTISKSCNNEFEDNQCKQSYLGLKVVLRCTCDSNFCNGDRNLVAAGLQRMEDNGTTGRRAVPPNGRGLMMAMALFATIGGALFVTVFTSHFATFSTR